MASEHVEDKSEQSEDSSSSAWYVTTTMLIQFYKENGILWDKGHKDYEKKQIQKKAIMPLVAKLGRSNLPKNEEIKKRWHNIAATCRRELLQQLVARPVHKEWFVAATCCSDICDMLQRHVA